MLSFPGLKGHKPHDIHMTYMRHTLIRRCLEQLMKLKSESKKNMYCFFMFLNSFASITVVGMNISCYFRVEKTLLCVSIESFPALSHLLRSACQTCWGCCLLVT